MSYQSQPISKDILDILQQSAQEQIEVKQPDGSVILVPKLNAEILWAKTLMVNSNCVGEYIFDLKELERLGFEAYNSMNNERATMFAKTMVDYINSHKRGLDGKSSESMRDKENSQSTLLDKINKTQTEKIYTAKGEVARNVLAQFIHGDKRRDDEQ